MAQIQISLFVICSVWSRIHTSPPSSRDLYGLLLNGFPEVFGNPAPSDWLCDGVDRGLVRDAAKRILRARYGMKSQYTTEGNAKRISVAIDACNYMAAVWLCACDKPPDEHWFTHYVQSIFPKVDQIDIARHSHRICEDDMPVIYDIWFNKHEKIVEKAFGPDAKSRRFIGKTRQAVGAR